MRKYIYQLPATIEIIAENEPDAWTKVKQALESLNPDGLSYSVEVTTTAQDEMNAH